MGRPSASTATIVKYAEFVCCISPVRGFSASTRTPTSIYFRRDDLTPTAQDVADYYRERNMACVIFSVDAEAASGRPRIPNEEIAEVAAANPDVLIPFASIDPAKGRLGVREARRLVDEHG